MRHFHDIFGDMQPMRIISKWGPFVLVMALAGCHLVYSYEERALEPGAGDAALQDAVGQDRGPASDVIDGRVSPDAPPPQDALRPVDVAAGDVSALDEAARGVTRRAATKWRRRAAP